MPSSPEPNDLLKPATALPPTPRRGQRLLSRSPHPYHRHRNANSSPPRDQPPRSSSASAASSCLPSPQEVTPCPSDSEGQGGSRSRTPSRLRLSRTSSDSGTEEAADAEALSFVRALPAPLPPRRPSQLSEQPTRLPNAELLRRSIEVLLLAAIGRVLVSGRALRAAAQAWRTELVAHGLLVLALCAVYVARRPLRMPAAFDPAPLLYPAFVPVLVSLALAGGFPAALLPNVVLSLGALPAELIPCVGGGGGGGGGVGCYSLHWILTVVPLFLSENTQWVSKLDPPAPYHIKAAAERGLLAPERLLWLFPLQQALLPPLHSLTTTSLLPAELQLLAICMVNLLLLSRSPQSVILGAILWIGGLGLLLLTSRVLRWNVALERIPSWRFRSPRQPAKAKKSPVSSLRRCDASNGSANGTTHGIVNPNGKHALPSRSAPSTPSQLRHHRRQSTSAVAQAYLSMTVRQATVRKWLYAIYTYTVALILILLPIRLFIQKYALHGHEPFGWAIGYLFGQIPIVRSSLVRYALDHWAAVPTGPHGVSDSQDRAHGWVEQGRRGLVGEANARLAIFTYWLAIVLVGIASVLRLSSVAQVDTRRKVFHGMMVAMLLPTTFIDPAFLALGLAIVLAVFLLLDVFRAAQLRPLSQPLAAFLAPYVDGRDLRGPVVISHMFLLIGCAIPLWLSLAATPRAGTPPWHGWEVVARDVSMVAGVVCVGMGDAAASLVGRRYGRHRWPWEGGKSLEGSAAFAAAATAGLLFGNAWLRLGGWNINYTAVGDGQLLDAWGATAVKCAVAAVGASLTEAVLTGCNDNVVVPITLWLLVRGLQLC